MSDLAEFLLARIAEDQERIHGCDSDGEFRAAWLTFRRPDGSMDYTTVAVDHRNDIWVADGSAYQKDVRVHVDEPFFDARRVLAECDAKRRIVELHQDESGNCELCCHWSSDGYDPIAVPWPCETLKLLALPYADHPDYREEWRP